MSKMIVRIILLTVFLIIVVYFIAGPIFTNSKIKDKIGLLYSLQTEQDENIDFKTPEFLALPQIVSRYLKNSITAKTKPRQVNKIILSGEIRDDRYSPWEPTQAEHYYSLSSPAFVFEETVSTYEVLWTKKIHTLFENKAELQIKFLSSIMFDDLEGTKLDQSAFLLYLLNSVFSPTLLLPNQNIQWRGIDRLTAEVVLWHKSVSGRVVFHFNESGYVEKVVSEDMFIPNTIESDKTVFTLLVANYHEFSGIKIPTYLEYQWTLADGKFVSERYNISSVEFD